jgi:hypothetical protein
MSGLISDRDLIAFAITGIIILLTILSVPGVTPETIAKENYESSKSFCQHGWWKDDYDNISIIYPGNLSMIWDETTQTCWCDRYYVLLEEDCNLTTYWWIPRDYYFYTEKQSSFGSLVSDVKWCEHALNCTRIKYKLKKVG